MQEDGHFVDLLNGIRTGENTAAFEEIVMRCRRTLRINNGIQPTVLYSKYVVIATICIKAQTSNAVSTCPTIN